MILLNIIFSLIIVFLRRKEPKSVWAWLLLLYSLPIIGFIIYLFCGINMHKKRMFKLKQAERKVMAAIERQEKAVINHVAPVKDEKFEKHSGIVMYNLQYSDAVMSNDNDVRIYTDGISKFNALIEDIKKAEKFIHFQYYIIRNDELFDRISKELIKKAEEGVKVRILYDAMGCRNTPGKYWKSLKEHENVEVCVFFPAYFKRIQLRLNYRNHRKICVIDNKVGYVGGFNVGREYIDLSKKFGHWRDTHLRIEGSAVNELGIRFALDWNYAMKTNLFSDPSYFEPHRRKVSDGVGIQIISSGPDSSLQNIRNNYLMMFGKAQKSIYIQTPYFIPDEPILAALLVAVRSGVEVNIMIPCKPDHPFVYSATLSYVGQLVMAGANCYTYDDGFIHAKGVIIDEEMFCYGTANMDIRSFALNFEVNAVVYDKKKAKEMTEIFINDLKACTKIEKDDYEERGLFMRFKEQFSRLLSPIL